jgi:penicillin-binding protein 1A
MAIVENRPRNKARKSRFYKRKGFWLTLLLFTMVAGVAGWLGAVAYMRPYRERADTYDLARINDLEVPSVILDRNGKEIGRIFVQNRSIIPVDEIPERFINALRAGEDSRYYEHKGVDYIGIMRAVKLNLEAREVNQGASTITQQLARNAYPLKQEAAKRNESGVERKLVEAFLAIRIEKRYSKKEILDFYLNRIYFGSGFYGIRSASLGYFGKEPKDLTVEECASIVALIKNPTNLSPLNNPEANLKARNYVLLRMKEEGFISASELATYQALPVSLDSKPLRRSTSHLYERVADAVGRALGEDALATGGFKVHTTILAEAQEAAQKALEKSLDQAERRVDYTGPKRADYRRDSAEAPAFLQGAVLMIDHETGDVLAHVGGRDYANVPYDFIELGRRPLGTAFFPFLYAAGLAGGHTPVVMLEDEPMDNRAVMVGGREGILGEWGMEVASPVYEGEVTVRRAFEASKIAATVRFGGMVGLDRIVQAGAAFGFPMQQAELLPRLCVGWESASMRQAVRAISTFPRGGVPAPQAMGYLDRIESSAGNVVYRRNRSKVVEPQRVLDDATAYQVHSMMAGSMVRGSGAGALEGLDEKPFAGAGKGGTTHDFSDTWFLGYNSRVSCGVWTGYLQSSGEGIYPGAFSRDLALPVWQATMNAAAPSFGGEEIAKPDTVVEVPVCSVSGQRATDFCQEMEEDLTSGVSRSKSTAIAEFFRRGTEGLPFCAKHSGAISDSVSPEMALSNLPALDMSPVLPQGPVLIGEDPYHTELPSFSQNSGTGGLMRRRTNVLDSLDLGDGDEGILLPRPKRLVIIEE